MNNVEAKNALVGLFTLNDVPCVCAFVGCDHENLPAKTKDEYFRELVLWSNRHTKFTNLVQVIQFISLLMVRMNIQELKDMAFDLGLHNAVESEYRTKSSFILHILYLIQQHELSKQFQDWLREQRPDIVLSFSS